MTTLAITIVAAVIAWGAVVERFRNAEPLEVRGRPEAIVWDERVFRTEAGLAKYLRGHGIAYERWARNHPDAVAILRPPPVVVSSAPTPARPPQPERSADPAASAEAPDPTLSAASFVMPLAALFALALAIGASTAARRARQEGAEVSSVAASIVKYRIYLFSAAAGVALAVLISVAL